MSIGILHPTRVSIFNPLTGCVNSFAFADSVSSYTLDANGNVVYDSSVDRSYEYDSFNHLVGVYDGSVSPANLREEYIYDENGIRVYTKKFWNGTTEEVFTPSKEYMEIKNSSGNYKFVYVYDDGDTLVAVIEPDGSRQYYHPDHLGSTNLITSENGSVVENTFYQPFGAVG